MDEGGSTPPSVSGPDGCPRGYRPIRKFPGDTVCSVTRTFRGRGGPRTSAQAGALTTRLTPTLRQMW
eukprot:5100286-Alexandrium_andersonii.AAC.1